MKKYFLLLLMVWTLQIHAQVLCSSEDRCRIEQLLREASRMKARKAGSWMLYFGRKFVGVPYVGGTLDRTKEEQLIVNLSELDCTTYVEQVAALTRCAEQRKTTFAAFCDALRHIRYIGGKVDYVCRQHYFTVWMDDNEREKIVEKIDSPNPPFCGIQTVRVNYMSTHVGNYKMLDSHPQWLTGIRALEQSVTGKRYRYIPKNQIGNSCVRKSIQDGDILVILTKKKGLDTSHIGIAVWGKDGKLHLLNASSIHHQVIEEPMSLWQYMQKHPSQLGIRVCRVK